MRNIFPTICADDVAGVSDFYQRFLGFEVVFDSGWYVQLGSTDDLTRQIGIVQRTHETVPDSFRERPAGVLIAIELDDVDSVHRAIVDAGGEIVLDIRSEDFGQRHFMSVDPAGTFVDVITQIEPSADMSEFGMTSAPGES